MRLLLDTHAFIWWASDSRQLTGVSRQALADPANVICLSPAVAWEIAIKVRIGRLRLDLPLDVLVAQQRSTNGLRDLPIRAEHALRVGDLELHHRDPFDRMLVARAMIDGLTIMTHDASTARYGVTVIW